jgi:hypothetical protein
MQDVFEPTANFGGEVFEPTANFGGEVFEPMNFEGDYSNFGLFKKKNSATTSTQSKPTAETKPTEPVKPKEPKKPTDWSKIGTNVGNAIKFGVDTYTQIAPAIQKPEFQRNLEATCGKSGQFLGIGKPRESYLTCAKNFMEKQGVSNAQFDQWKENLDSDTGGSTPPSTGMSLGAKIGITAGILAVVGVAVFFIVKGGKKGK